VHIFQRRPYEVDPFSVNIGVAQFPTNKRPSHSANEAVRGDRSCVDLTRRDVVSEAYVTGNGCRVIYLSRRRDRADFVASHDQATLDTSNVSVGGEKRHEVLFIRRRIGIQSVDDPEPSCEEDVLL
jgi:hypothetical protein